MELKNVVKELKKMYWIKNNRKIRKEIIKIN